MMAEGCVIFFDNKGQYGFIEADEGGMPEIFFHKTSCGRQYRNIVKGDRVRFELEELAGEARVQAIHVEFAGNARKDELRASFEEQRVRWGFLKTIDGVYYIKDKISYINIRLCITQYEDAGDYGQDIDRPVEFRISEYTTRNKMRAVREKRKFIDDYYILKNGGRVKGRVLQKVKGGYLVSVLNNITGFLPNSQVLEAGAKLEVNGAAEVVCLSINDDTGNTVFGMRNEELGIGRV